MNDSFAIESSRAFYFKNISILVVRPMMHSQECIIGYPSL